MTNSPKAGRRASKSTKTREERENGKPASVRVAKVKPVAEMVQEPDDDTWNLRLYVAGDSPKSRTAIANLERLCETHLSGQRYRIEVVDLKQRPDLAKADQILALPTLIRKVPEPVKRLIGDLSNAERTLVGLDMSATSLQTRRGESARSEP